MYATSTQKRSWTFASLQQLQETRQKANQAFIDKTKHHTESLEHQHEVFFTPEEEQLLCRVVANTGLRFGHDFTPELPPAVRWIAFMYYKRFFLKLSLHENPPKNIMMGCYYLATKVDEFNISVRHFCNNLKSGTPEGNAELILKLEPKLMEVLDFHLTVHSPYRPFEGHLVEMRTRMPLIAFDVEKIRAAAYRFFDRALMTDAMLLYAPTQIALAALKYGLEKTDMSIDVLKDFFYKFLDLDDWNSRDEDKEQVEKLLKRINEISNLIVEQSKEVDKDKVAALQRKAAVFQDFYMNIASRTEAQPEPGNFSDDSD